MVYTLDGQSEQLLSQSYRILAQRLGLKIENVPSEDIFAIVKGELEKSTYKGWLLLFDNADESDMLDFLYDKLPMHGGNIVITSRVALDWENVAVIEVNQFKRTDSISLLEKIIRKDRQCDHKTLDALAEALGDLPLALTQAGAYINSFKRKGYNAAEYLTAFQKSYANSATRLAKFKGTVEYHNRRIITTTWDTSRKSIREECPLADEALCLFAYLNPEKIPSNWMERWLQNRGIQDKEELEEKISEIINTLYEGYSMIHYEEEDGISIHRLVQRVVQGSLPEEERRKFIGEALKLVKEKFDPYDHDDPKTWGIGRECLPHAISVTIHVLKHYPDFNELEDSEREIPEQMGALFHAMGIYVMCQGNAFQAIEYYEKALEILKSFLGESHPSVASTLHNLGTAWSSLGEKKKAIEYYEKALEMKKSFLGESHPSVADTLHNLGNAWSDLGEKKKAIEYYEKALEMKKSFLGESHPSVAETLNNLGTAWSDLGENKKAIEYYEKALEMKKSFLGESHPSVAETLNNLGTAWSDLGENKKAIEYYEKALEMKKSFLGESHPSVASTLHNLGTAWSDLGENKKAIEYYEKALKMKKSFLGESHPSVASTLHNLGNAWSELGEREKAIEYYEKALEMKKSFLGESHPSVADTLNNLGNAWRSLGEKKKAIEYYEKALEMTKAFLGESHPSVASTLHNLGTAWSDLGEREKAIEYLEQAYTMHKQFLGESHPNTRMSKSRLDYCKGNESSMDFNTLLMLLRALSNKEEEETPDDTTAETPDQNECLRQILTSALSEADGDQSEPTEPSSTQCSPQ